MSGSRITEAESELGRCGALIGEIVDMREIGNRDPLAGNSDDDLQAAVEELEDAIKTWRARS